jgi:hypothetical protein
MDKFDELKFLHERTQRFSERRQITSQTYLTINTVIFGAIAFLLKDSGLRGWNLILVSLPFFGVGLLACIIWYRILRHLESMIGWHYQQLREIEEKIPDSHLTFNKEWEKFYRQKGKKRFSFSGLESQLPSLLIGLYTVYGISLVLAVIFSWL